MAVAPLPAFFIAVVYLSVCDSHTVFESPGLLAILNTVFLGLVPLSIAFLAARSYRATGHGLFLLLGSGLLAFGVCCIIGGWAMSTAGGANAMITLHNLGCLGAGLCCFVSSLLLFTAIQEAAIKPTTWARVVAPYALIVLVVLGISVLAEQRRLPAFFVPGLGPTPLRQWVLGVSMALFSCAGILFLAFHARMRTAFAYWYGLAMLLIAIGLLGVFLQSSVGSQLGWVGRGAQYLSGIYLMVALLTSRRDVRRGATGSGTLWLWPFLEERIQRRTIGLHQQNDALQKEVDARKQAEQDVRNLLWRLEGIIEGTKVGTWEWNVQTGETVFNERWAQILGYTLAELAPISIKTWERFAHPDDLKTSSESLERHFAGEAPFYDCECRMKHRDGTWVWVHDRGRVVTRTADGLPLMMFGTHADITERKRITEDLRNLALKQEAMLSNTADVIGIIGSDGVMAYKSPNIEKWFGWRPHERVGTSGWDTIHPDDLERIQTIFLKVLGQDRSVTTMEFRYACKDGSYKPVELTAINLVNDPVIHGVLLNYHDITDRKQAETAAAKEQAFNKAIIDSVMGAFYAIGEHGRYVRWNAYQRDEIIGKPEALVGETSALDTIHPDDRAFIQAAIASVMTTGMPAMVEGRVLLRGGPASRQLMMSGNRLMIDGHPFLVGIGLDITERKQSEELLAQAMSKAQAANLAKSQFLSTMSHEIRTPLNGVIGMTDMLLKSNLTPHQMTMTKLIQDSGRSLLAVIGNVLDMAKIESGKIELIPLAFKVHDLVVDLQGMFSSAVHAKTLRFTVCVDPAVPPRLVGDMVRLRQVLINLLGNAVKFTERGEVAVTVGAVWLKPNHVTLTWDLRDTGPGIPQDYLPHLFQPFSQADATMSRTFGGTGLGLAIAKKMTDLMGGSLTVETEVGRGTCFHLAIPLEIAALAEITADPERPTAPQAWSRPPSVLVVEDDATSQFTLDLMLTNLGCPHQSAKDGNEGIAAVAAGAFDIVLMDCQMPECDGYTATRTIRERAPAGSRRLPIIALTANVFTEDRERCREAGMDDFLAKPCDLDALKACLVKWAGNAANEAQG